MNGFSLTDLNAPQREAVEHAGGPLLILAGAGSGKTRVITYRIAHLISQLGVRPGQILAVTFTNKAAREMRERVDRLLHHDAARHLWLGTFHALCLRILKREVPYAFSVYDDEDSLRLLKTCQRELNWDDKSVKLEQAAYRIESAKHELLDAAQYQQAATDYLTRQVAKLYARYQEKLAANHAFDFGDLIMAAVKLLAERPEVLEKYRGTFRHILVDEYQDINHAQYAWIRLLAGEEGDLTVVGDDDQSIYQFRGADIRNILEFERDYPRARVIKLEQNYRSTQTILEAAWAVVKNNPRRKEKKLWTEKPGGAPLVYYRGEAETDEAAYVVRQVQRLQDGPDTAGGSDPAPLRLADFVVLYRTNAQSRPLEDALRRERMPYRIVGGMKFYDRMEIKDVLAYLNLLVNPADELSLTRVINTPPRGLGEGSLAKLRELAAAEKLTLFAALEKAAGTPGAWPERLRRSLEDFLALMRDLQVRRGGEALPRFLTSLITESGYLAMWQAASREEGAARIENLNELIAAAEEFTRTGDGSLEGFLDQVALAASLDERADSGDQLTLMTLHSAKGLEFRVVFMVGMEEGLFPHGNALQDEQGLYEERRLCYVGMTRAREKLFLTGAATRSLFGNRIYNSESRFLYEMPARLFGGHKPLRHQQDERRDSERGLWRGRAYGGPADEFVDAPSPEDVSQEPHAGDESAGYGELLPGRRVTHARFGVGTIIGKSGEGEDLKLEIAFSRHGRKQILARFSGLDLLPGEAGSGRRR